MTWISLLLPAVAAIIAALYEGAPKTDARWLTWATGLKKGTEKAGRWAHRPRLQRRAVQAAAAFLAGWIAAGVLMDRGVTILAVILAAAVAAAWGCAAAYQRARQHAAAIGHVTLWGTDGAIRHAPAVASRWWNHHHGYMVRLRDSLVPVFGVTPWKVRLPPDLSAVTIRPPYTFAGRKDQLEAITATVRTLIPVEGLEPDWSKLHGFAPRIGYAQAEPPPGILYWDDIAKRVDAARYDQLISGVGHYRKLIASSLDEDSPMFGIGAGTGGCKSNLAAFWIVQRLRKGDFALIIDGKRFSHPWAFKDMDARYGLLPNVGYVREISGIHDALVWLGMLLAERNELAERFINAQGDLLGDVGRKLWVLLEELNLVIPLLKAFWQAIRQKGDPKESPALMALSAVSCAGRAVGIHLIFLGQRLDAEVLGSSGSKGGAVRGNVGVRALARYDEQSWALQAGRGCHMPPSPSVPGRMQLWVRGQVHEVQVPYMNHKKAVSELRELATGGIVTPCPVGMPGRSQVSVLNEPVIPRAPDQPVVLGKTPIEDNLISLAKAHAAGMFGGRTLGSVQRASTRKGFPGAVRKEGRAHLYDFDQLAAWAAGKELVK